MVSSEKRANSNMFRLYWRGVLHSADCFGEVSCIQLALLERCPAAS